MKWKFIELCVKMEVPDSEGYENEYYIDIYIIYKEDLEKYIKETVIPLLMRFTEVILDDADDVKVGLEVVQEGYLELDPIEVTKKLLANAEGNKKERLEKYLKELEEKGWTIAKKGDYYLPPEIFPELYRDILPT